MPSLKSLFAAGALGYLASAKTIEITATKDNKFDPDNVKGDKGDVLEFHFEPKNHSVVAGDYRYPCSPLPLGSVFYSSFISTDDDKADRVFRVTLNDTEPIVFYSSQGNECSKGMVGIVNQNDNHTLADYRDRAAKLNLAVSPPGRQPLGGELVDEDEADDRDDKDDNKDDDDKEDSKDGDKNGDEGIAGNIRVPVVGLLSAAAAAAAALFVI